MARNFHNLAGFIRDLRACLSAGHELAYELAELILEVDELVDPSVAAAADSAVQQSEAQLDLPDCDDSGEIRGFAPRHDTSGGTPLGSVPRLESPMERVRHLASQAMRQPGNADAVVRTAPGRRLLTGGQKVDA